MPPAARISDFHTCPKVEPGPVPHVGGPVVVGSANVIVGNMPAGRVGDMLVCVGPPDAIKKGSATVLINNKEAARIGDPTNHGGVVVAGCPTVIIGDTGQGEALKGAAASGAPFCEECEKARKALEEELKKQKLPDDTISGEQYISKCEHEAHATEKQLNDMYKSAQLAKDEVDASAKKVADKHGGRLADAPLKSRRRVLEKAAKDYDGDLTRVKDIARNTVVVERGHEHHALASLRELHPEIADKHVKVVDHAADPLGYSGITVSVPTKSGMPGEVQINSPHMIYAKEKPEDALRILGKEHYERIAKTPGMPEGGQGHKMYETWRASSDPAEKARVAKESRAYYDSVRKLGGG